MSNTIGNIIADSLSLGMGYAERLQKDIPVGQFARFARNGDDAIVSNHPAFIYGHLSLYPSKMITQLGEDASAWSPTEEFNALFSKDATCKDDPDGTLYPAMDEVLSKFTGAYEAVRELLRATEDDKFQAANPQGGRMLELFPTIGSMHAFYAGGHFMIHMGQLSAWRRMIGLGAA